jgi:hypothetical protein
VQKMGKYAMSIFGSVDEDGPGESDVGSKIFVKFWKYFPKYSRNIGNILQNIDEILELFSTI